MAKVKFLATTLTSKGRFEAGETGEFTEAMAKDLQRLTTVESPTEVPAIKEEELPKPEKKKVKKYESKKSSKK